MEQIVDAINKPEFWKRIWEEARKTSSYGKRNIRSEKEVIEFWNRVASRYGNNDINRDNRRLERVVSILKEEEIITPETDILDVGCGPGTYALFFAKKVKSVTALDGAIEMCRVLKKTAEKMKIDNIHVLNRMWEEVETEREGFNKAFDLTFASMTPAVCDLETLNKLNQTSRKSCCLISWAGGVSLKARQDLWKLFFDEEITGNGNNIIFPFNLLFHSGYYPSMRYLDDQWVREQPVEEAIENLCSFFWLYTDITPEVKSTITRYVQENARNNMYSQEFSSRLGMIYWRVDERDGR